MELQPGEKPGGRIHPGIVFGGMALLSLVGLFTCGRALFTHEVAPQVKTPAQVVADRLAHPERALELVSQGQLDRLASVLILGGQIRNTGALPIRDPLIVCTMAGASGTATNRVATILYERIDSGETQRFSGLNMGFVNPQAQRIGCVIERAAWAS